MGCRAPGRPFLWSKTCTATKRRSISERVRMRLPDARNGCSSPAECIPGIVYPDLSRSREFSSLWGLRHRPSYAQIRRSVLARGAYSLRTPLPRRFCPSAGPSGRAAKADGDTVKSYGPQGYTSHTASSMPRRLSVSPRLRMCHPGFACDICRQHAHMDTSLEMFTYAFLFNSLIVDGEPFVLSMWSIVWSGT